MGGFICLELSNTNIQKSLVMDNNNSEKIVREALADMFGILEYKVRSGAMTYEDMLSLVSIYETNGGIKATVQDLAGYYGQSEDNVRHVLHRTYMPKPTRRVYYDMLSFAKNVPLKWHRNGSNSRL